MAVSGHTGNDVMVFRAKIGTTGVITVAVVLPCRRQES